MDRYPGRFGLLVGREGVGGLVGILVGSPFGSLPDNLVGKLEEGLLRHLEDGFDGNRMGCCYAFA